MPGAPVRHMLDGPEAERARSTAPERIRSRYVRRHASDQGGARAASAADPTAPTAGAAAGRAARLPAVCPGPPDAYARPRGLDAALAAAEAALGASPAHRWPV